ncbi:P-II family nitrogen regulator [Methanobacterium alcaliphilum]|uniref:P-II family nitrogen regulator n=1 Tax=Methanobacterium alcaliphilum TaxID=392018 RepID=UPI00200A5DEC|nr:P-II family nitrogen regulator [Methanobacterium alcaliphilum]MCK9151799.1 P-II family nitrogen regulator [Methanobacterium alcaliphilum]
MMENTCSGFKLIYVIVEAGRGSFIMSAAREAGAEGGTTYYARGTSIHEHGKFLGVPIEPEKEVVMIIIKDSLVNQVFESVVTKGELEEPGKGVAFILDISRVAGICHLLDE